MSKPKLTLMCGLPASGKSAFANMFKSENTIVLSSDELRVELYNNVNDTNHNEQVFNELYKRARQNLLKDKDVIIDATNITIKSRRKALRHFEDINCYKECVIMATPYYLCLIHNKVRDRKVPVEVIRKMYQSFQIPFYEEGFDYIEIIEDILDKSNIPRLLNKMNGFDQKTPHHKYDLLTHCDKTYDEISHDYPPYIATACLLHDYGKLYTQSFDSNGVAHYYNHANVGAYEVMTNAEIYSDEDMLDIIFIINYHMLPFSWNTEKAQNKWRKIFGEEKYNLLVEFNRCDRIASGTEE